MDTKKQLVLMAVSAMLSSNLVLADTRILLRRENVDIRNAGEFTSCEISTDRTVTVRRDGEVFAQIVASEKDLDIPKIESQLADFQRTYERYEKETSPVKRDLLMEHKEMDLEELTRGRISYLAYSKEKQIPLHIEGRPRAKMVNGEKKLVIELAYLTGSGRMTLIGNVKKVCKIAMDSLRLAQIAARKK